MSRSAYYMLIPFRLLLRKAIQATGEDTEEWHLENCITIPLARSLALILCCICSFCKVEKVAMATEISEKMKHVGNLIFVFDSMRTRSHLFFRYLSTSGEVYPIYHPFVLAAYLGPDRWYACELQYLCLRYQIEGLSSALLIWGQHRVPKLLVRHCMPPTQHTAGKKSQG
jgi:hypothetical protein